MLRTVIIVLLLLLASSQGYGQRWAQATLPAPYDRGYYLDIYFLPTNTSLGWACDNDSGYVVRTTDGGRTWAGTRIGTPGQSCHLEYIQFLNASVGYCSGPCGAFKSTDGGASWTALTLPAGYGGIWGGWFRSTTTGWFTGGGCGNNVFYRTTDGGATFSVYRDTVIKRSNLSDPLWNSSMAAGTVYAIGNGTLWKSDDDGLTWYVDGYTGANSPWHEEISISGNTFMVAGATTNCVGGTFTGGSIRTSTDGGQLWQEYNTGKDMFGVHLVNDSTAWASGWQGAVLYTKNKGATWEWRTCGIGTRGMDDVFFINETNGWLAGDGIFYLAKALRTARPASLDLVSPCPDSTKRDTIWVRNINFSASRWQLALTGPHDYLFRVANPLPNPMPACDSVAVIIEYRAVEAGPKTAQLVITINDPDTVITIPLTANRTPPTAFPVDTLIVQNARVGQVVDRVLFWRSNTGTRESIISIIRESGDTNITLTAPLPQPINAPPQLTETYIKATPRDTGWIEARFRVRLSPCIRDTFITVRIYGQSPIFNSIATASASNACSPQSIIDVPISNTGNIDLSISNMQLTGTGAAAFTIMGFASGAIGPPWKISKGASDTLRVRYIARSPLDVATLEIDHDDVTTARGVKTPWKIELTGTSQKPAFTVSPIDIDLGSMCLGQQRDTTITIGNTGGLGLSWLASGNARFKGLPTSFAPLATGSSVDVRFQWRASVAGQFSDTLRVTIRPCDSIVTVIVHANVVNAGIVVDPDPVTETVVVGGTIDRSVAISVVGIDSLVITSLTLQPPTSITLITPATPVVVYRDTPLNVRLQWTSNVIETVNADLIVAATGACNVTNATPITFRTLAPGTQLDRSALDFDLQCASNVALDTIMLSTTNDVTVNPPTIAQSGTAFRVVEPIAATVVPAGNTLPIIVSYDPRQGTATGSMRIVADPGAVEYFVDLKGANQASILSATPNGFVFDLVACDPVFSTTVTIRNTGDLQDIVRIDAADLPAGILVNPTSAAVPAGSATDFTLIIDPAALSAGSTTSTINFLGTACTDTVVVTVSTVVSQSGLTLSPPITNAGVVAVGNSSDHAINVSNEGPTSRTVISLRIVPSIPDWTIVNSIQGQVIGSDSNATVTVRFAPVSAGPKDVRLEMIDMEQCTTVSSVELRGMGRDVLSASTRFRIDRYDVLPGTRLDVPVHWESDIRRAQPDSVRLLIESSHIMFLVDSVTVTYPFAQMTAALRQGSVELFFRKLDKDFGISGTAAVLHGTAQAAIPDSTPVHFADVTTWAVDPVGDESIDGLIHVQACGPHVAVLFKDPTSVSILPPQPAGDVVRFQVKAPYAEDLHVVVYDGIGNVQRTLRRSVGEGTSVVEVDVADLPSGHYIVRFETGRGGVFNASCIVVH